MRKVGYGTGKTRKNEINHLFSLSLRRFFRVNEGERGERSLFSTSLRQNTRKRRKRVDSKGKAMVHRVHDGSPDSF